jgi:hypothetical protein
MDALDAVADLCAAQLGVIARWQFPGAVSAGRVDRFLASAGMERLYRGVYAVRAGAVHRHRGAIAAALRVGPKAILSGPAALELGPVDGIWLSDDFVVLRQPPLRMTGDRIPLASDRDPTRACERLGEVRIAPPADALLDTLARPSLPPPRRLRLAHDQLRWAGRLQPGSLADRARQLRAPAAVRQHELLALDATPATGDGERHLGRLLSRFAPAPDPQVWVTPYRCVDWYFRSVRLGVEYQGGADHGTEAGRASDQRRDTELATVGIRLVYVTAADLQDERALVATVAGALTARALELGAPAPALR